MAHGRLHRLLGPLFSATTKGVEFALKERRWLLYSATEETSNATGERFSPISCLDVQMRHCLFGILEKAITKICFRVFIEIFRG